jgi:hypothetical protein
MLPIVSKAEKKRGIFSVIIAPCRGCKHLFNLLNSQVQDNGIKDIYKPGHSYDKLDVQPR